MAQLFPDLKIILAHLGNPWIAETIVVLRKHRHVFADVSGVAKQPWWHYNAFVLLQENGVLDKVLFGSDFPWATPENTVDALRKINDPAGGSAMPRILEEAIEALVHRDTLSLLGLT